LKIEATFVVSAASATDLPRDGLAEIAMVGRSNVGKSSLINALVRQRVARTSAAPGKTRLANVYRVRRGSIAPFYLLDLPGYGYARAPRQARGPQRGSRGGVEIRGPQRGSRGGVEIRGPQRGSRGGVEIRGSQRGGVEAVGALSPADARRSSQAEFEAIVSVVFERAPAALLLVDARHPGLASDRAAWQWIRAAAGDAAVVATKIDKLGRGERIRASRELESVFETSVLPVSAVTGEGLEQLWTLIDRLKKSC
jgi:GTP-binding protein EngB required for normal cell division